VGRPAVDRDHRLDGDGPGAGAAHGGGVGGQVCAGQGHHTAGLPVGAWLLGRSTVCATDVHECRSAVERGRDMIGPVVPGSHVGPPQPVFIPPGYLQAPETVVDAILLQPNDGEPAQ